MAVAGVSRSRGVGAPFNGDRRSFALLRSMGDTAAQRAYTQSRAPGNTEYEAVAPDGSLVDFGWIRTLPLRGGIQKTSVTCVAYGEARDRNVQWGIRRTSNTTNRPGAGVLTDPRRQKTSRLQNRTPSRT